MTITKQTTLLTVVFCVALMAASCTKPSAPPSGPSSTAKQAVPPTGIFGPPVTATTQITQADLIATAPLIPSDLYRPADDHAQAAKYAWLEFIALTAPNKPSPTRGVPGGAFTSVQGGTNSTYPLVFETYQHRSELFPANAQTGGVSPPQPWDQTPKYVYNPQPTVPNGVNYTLFNNLDEGSQIFQNHLFFPNANGQPFQVLFEAKANQMEQQYVANNYPLPASNTLYDGDIEVKVAWRPVASIDPSQLYRYHVANVITYGGTVDNPVAQNGQYALIALHIIHKTKNYPSFTFATFEQVDQFNNQAASPPTPTNVSFLTLYPTPDPNQSPTPLPTPATYQAGSYYFAVDPAGYSAQPSPSPGTFAATTNPTRVFDLNNPLAWPNGTQTSFTPAPNVSMANQMIKVVLPPTSTPEVTSVNQQVRNLISQLINQGTLPKDFVWQYYQLTGVQAVPSSDETTKDYYLANIVVESSQAGIQLFRGGLSPNPSFEPVPNIRNKFNVNDAASGQKYSMGGCMGCHGAAQAEGGDFSFLLGTGQAGFNVDPIAGTNLEQAMKNATARRALIRRSGKY